MLISFGFDQSMEHRRKKRFNDRERKAKHLATRLKMFIDEVNKDKIMNEKQKREVLNHLNSKQ